MNKIFRGIVIVPLYFILIILFVSGFEYIGWFSINIRFFIFIFSLGTILFFFISYLFFPILRYFNIAHRISNKKVSFILSQHFPDIKDSIINVIELNNLVVSDNELVVSSINQKISKLEKFEFTSAINFSENFKLLKFLGIAVLALVLTFLFQPKIFTQGTSRIVHYNQEFVKDIGVEIFIDTSNLTVKRGDNLEIEIELLGDKQFNNLFIVYGNREFLLEHSNANKFKYTFKNVNGSFQFFVKNNFIKSKNYKINVIDVPILKSYYVELNFPDYLNLESKTLHNISNIDIPEGTSIKWSFNSLYSDSILIHNSDTTFSLQSASNTFIFSNIAHNNITYNIDLCNQYSVFAHDILLSVNVIKDLYPSINVNYVKDKDNYRIFYFKGSIKDDYGFSKLKVFNGIDNSGSSIPINKNLIEQEFYFSYEFPVEQFNSDIYFKIYDNDILNGYKSTKSVIISIKIPTINELAHQQNEEFSKLENKLDQSLLLAEELKRDISDIKKSLINENLDLWEKQAKFKSIADKHKQLNKIVNELSQQNREKDVFKNSFYENKDELVEKQKQIQELFDNLMTDDIKKLLEELNNLANDFDENRINELTEDLELNYDDLSKQLDKNLELLKRFELEESINSQIDKLNELSKNQEKLGDNLKNEKINIDTLLSNNLNDFKKLENIKEEYNNIIEKNSELEKPFTLDDFNEDINKIEDNILDNNSDINNGKGDNKAQKNSKDLKALAEKMQNMMNSNMQHKAGEDADALRLLLENLFTFSFDQEKVMDELLNIRNDNPKFITVIKDQNKLSDDFSIVRDSLYALSKRNAALGFNVSKAAFVIETELFEINDLFENRNTGLIRKKQREILTASNDMILLLSESLKNMDSMGGSGGGSSNKKQKPKKGNQPSMSDLKKGQEGFKKQLEDMLKQMKGQNGKPGKNGMQQMGKMLAQQEILQQMMNEFLNSSEVGSKAQKQLKEIKKLMDANKRDLINMNLNNSTLFRQQQIMTRLLEAESAELERDQDEKRESNQAKNYRLSNPIKLFDDTEENINFNEIFNTNTVNLFNFYKYKYQEYLMKINLNSNEKRN